MQEQWSSQTTSDAKKNIMPSIDDQHYWRKPKTQQSCQALMINTIEENQKHNNVVEINLVHKRRKWLDKNQEKTNGKLFAREEN